MVKRQQKLAVNRETIHRLDELKSEDYKKVQGGIESSCVESDCCFGNGPILN